MVAMAMAFKVTGGGGGGGGGMTTSTGTTTIITSSKASSSSSSSSSSSWTTTAASASQIAMAILFDLWHYTWHRALHANRSFLYRNFHSWHNRLVVPYTFGALYGHPLEGFVVDTVGGLVAFQASILFFSLYTVKAVDNHCGPLAAVLPPPLRLRRLQLRGVPRRAPPAARRPPQLLPALLRRLG
ncbi:hypothetical protein U9M48_040512 [Paspalum notatum var. saurae]|uniref:aldehyde oxygenase (deformylating) n=1 Tax=Paspalum notatum var. saurae TaxID=547442 RepID=A0AAQ3XDU5_PASNO